MQPRMLIILLAPLFLFISFSADAAEEPAQRIPVEWYLERVALLQDTNFTIEEAWLSGEPRNQLAAHLVEWQSGVNDPEQHMAYLQRSVQNFSWTQAQESSAVIHIVDTRLQTVRNYAMPALLHDFEYVGDLPGLALGINKAVPHFGLRRGAPFSRLKYVDITSVVIVPKHREVTVREAITSCLPLAGYRRILWTSDTPIQGQGDTRVVFSGRRKAEFFGGLYHSLDKNSCDLHLGEITYAACLKEGKKNAAATIKYIRECGPEAKRSSQLRWALRLLGDTQADEGIPVLMEYVSWQYAPCWVTEESYPAVYALTQYGKAVTPHVLRALSLETKEVGRQLLCYVLARVEGEDAAKGAVQRQLGASATTEEKQNLKATLTALETVRLPPPAKAK